jgi:hypothetical protein
MRFDEADESRIKQGFEPVIVSRDVHHEAHQSASNDADDVLINMLRNQLMVLEKQLDVKDRQIEALNAALTNEQMLHGGSIRKRLSNGIESSKGWMFWKRKK